MTDLFEDKARDWDARPLPAIISEGVGAALLDSVTLSPDMKVMDFGAGTGLLCAHVAPHVETIYAVDVSAAMLEKLAAKPALAGKVQAVCQDILDTPLGRPVDLIVSAMALHHVENTQRLLETFFEHLRPGGSVALADLDSEAGTFHPADTQGVFHNGFDREQMQSMLRAAGFGDVRFVTAVTLDRDGTSYPVFLVTATRA